MSEEISRNTQAVLLLTAPLLVGRNRPAGRLLTDREYRHLARCLHEAEAEPGDLLGPNASALIVECCRVADEGRLEALLGRGLLLGQAVERWRARGIWVASRGDTAYPPALKERLGEDAPSVLYGCGSPALWGPGGLAVVGSRDIGPEASDFAARQGALAARAGRIVVSGGARGADRAAMDGAMAAGGGTVGVLSSDLERTSMTRQHRNRVLDERLLLLSPRDPNARFNVGYAMGRNKVIYALADAALVVEATAGKGGTWSGAIEQLEKYGTPLYVRRSGGASPGLDALQARGAKPWPEPTDADALAAAFEDAPQTSAEPPGDQGDLFDSGTRPPDGSTEANAERREAGTPDHAEELYRHAAALIRRICATPMPADSVATALGVTPPTAGGWIKRLVAEGALLKRLRPVRYVARQGEPIDGETGDQPDEAKSRAPAAG